MGSFILVPPPGRQAGSSGPGREGGNTSGIATAEKVRRRWIAGPLWRLGLQDAGDRDSRTATQPPIGRVEIRSPVLLKLMMPTIDTFKVSLSPVSEKLPEPDAGIAVSSKKLPLPLVSISAVVTEKFVESSLGPWNPTVTE